VPSWNRPFVHVRLFLDDLAGKQSQRAARSGGTGSGRLGMTAGVLRGLIPHLDEFNCVAVGVATSRSDDICHAMPCHAMRLRRFRAN